jgi:hypothetical protein
MNMHRLHRRSSVLVEALDDENAKDKSELIAAVLNHAEIDGWVAASSSDDAHDIGVFDPTNRTYEEDANCPR